MNSKFWKPRSIIIAAATVASIGACKKDAHHSAPTLTTNNVSSITYNTATGGGTITSNGGEAITASGICWSSLHNTPSITTDTFTTGSTATGSFTGVILNLVGNTSYYVRAYATNRIGTSYGNVVTFNTTQDTTKVTFIYNGKTVTYGVVVSPTTSRKWMDRNLGANRVATSANDSLGFGDLFEWGRGADGHQLRNSDTTSNLSSADAPGNAKFILTQNAVAYDWRVPSNDNLWQGSTGVNNACPAGWHIPTQAEWMAETGVKDSTSGFSLLKLTATSGYRWIDGLFYGATSGSYWTSTPFSQSGNAFDFKLRATSASASAATQRGNGFTVRCIKD